MPALQRVSSFTHIAAADAVAVTPVAHAPIRIERLFSRSGKGRRSSAMTHA